MSFARACRALGRNQSTIWEFAQKHGYTHQEAIDNYRKIRKTKRDHDCAGLLSIQAPSSAVAVAPDQKISNTRRRPMPKRFHW